MRIGRLFSVDTTIAGLVVVVAAVVVVAVVGILL